MLTDLCPASRVEVGDSRVTRARLASSRARSVELAIYADALAGEAASLAARAERARSRLRQAAIEKRARRRADASVAIERLEALGLLGVIDERRRAQELRELEDALERSRSFRLGRGASCRAQRGVSATSSPPSSS